MLEKPYFAEARLRQKLAPWKLQGIPGCLERKVLRNLDFLQGKVPPRVMAVYFRSIWGGWATDCRMRSLLRSQDRTLRPCVLGCGWDEDSLYHYSRCKVYWHFLAMPRKGGLGIPLCNRSAEAFLLLAPLGWEDQIRLAFGMYALYRAVQHLRHCPEASGPSASQAIALLKAFLPKAALGSNCAKLLFP